MLDLCAVSWLLIISVAICIGIAKTGTPAVGVLLMPLMALAFPDTQLKQSVGALLPPLIFGDLMAIAIYRKQAEVGKLFQLAWGVVPGMALGVVVLFWLEAAGMKILLGVLVLILLAVELGRKVGLVSKIPHNRQLALTVGVGAGLGTTVGNAAGPIMGIYLLMLDCKKTSLLGTVAFFFLAVNLLKVPIFLLLRMFSWETIIPVLLCTPFVLVGAVAGKKLQQWLTQSMFDWLVLGVALFSGLALLLR